MRLLALLLLTLILLVQNPLWFGKGGVARVRELERQISAQREVNGRLRARNGALDAEVRDLKAGYGAIEERARAELGMIRPDELYYQLAESGTLPLAAPSPPR